MTLYRAGKRDMPSTMRVGISVARNVSPGDRHSPFREPRQRTTRASVQLV